MELQKKKTRVLFVCFSRYGGTRFSEMTMTLIKHSTAKVNLDRYVIDLTKRNCLTIGTFYGDGRQMTRVHEPDES